MIEFAVAMPVLIILIMYIHDLALMKRYYDQMEFVALQMVNMIQNVSQKRANKAITANDLRYIVSAAFLTIYPGTTMFYQGKGHGLIHFPHPFMYYVRGNSDGTASVVWFVKLHTAFASYGQTPQAMKYEVNNADTPASKARFKRNVAPSEIYPTLRINPGEVKIIVEPLIYWNSDYQNNVGAKVCTARQVFGFYLLTPKAAGGAAEFFSSPVIFSPKPGLFSETAPL